MNIRKLLTVATLAGLSTLVVVDPALAQEAWEQPAIKLIELLESGLVKIGAALIGIGIIAFGAWGALSGRLDWSKFGMMLIGGLLVMAGPTMLRAILQGLG